MFSWLIDTAHAMGTSGGSGAQGDAQAQNPIVSFIPLILIFVIFYFLMIRPQQKQAKERKSMLEAISRGDEVVTSGGLLGKVTAITDEVLTVEIADGVRVRVQRGAVVAVTKKSE